MQPVRLGALVWCFVTSALFAVLVLAPSSSAQTVLETPQQVNDRIRSLSSTARLMPHDYVIGNGDLLDVEVFDVKELSREVRVSQTGSIGIPLVPVRLHLAGLTEMQAEQKISEVLEANGLVSHPEVSVTVKERKSKPITVVGAVQHAMVYQADRPVTLLEVLAEAGGIGSDAGDTVIVTRPALELQDDSSEPPVIGPEDPSLAKPSKESAHPNSAQQPASSAAAVSNASSAQKTAPSLTNPLVPDVPSQLNNIITINLGQLMESGDTAHNIILQAGDVVTVPHAGIVYVLGAVNHAGGFVLTNDRAQMTTLKILALAGGLTRTAKSDHAVIVRKDNQGQQHEVTLDIKKVLNRKAEDLLLQPSDILYIPDSGAKQAVLRAVEIGVAVATGVLLYRVAYH
jgi:protein involved in polysaccharide export with SLBB domain